MQTLVNNTIVRIDTKREIAREEVKKQIVLLTKSFEINKATLSEVDLLEFSNLLKNHEYGKAIHIAVNTSSDKYFLYENMTIKDVTSSAKKYKTGLTKNKYIYAKLSSKLGDILIFALYDDIDTITKDYMYKELHDSVYEKNEYMWVNEILNYDGGDNYAVRLIHPDLKKTEGKYLSTNTTDIKGNLPYLDELNGIKKMMKFFTYIILKTKIAKKPLKNIPMQNFINLLIGLSLLESL